VLKEISRTEKFLDWAKEMERQSDLARELLGDTIKAGGQLIDLSTDQVKQIWDPHLNERSEGVTVDLFVDDQINPSTQGRYRTEVLRFATDYLVVRSEVPDAVSPAYDQGVMMVYPRFNKQGGLELRKSEVWMLTRGQITGLKRAVADKRHS